ncbi:hypothetical protein PSHT_00560 [Puccinia striiformis]|uniref:Uncharacterized protein n=2 Tax=Puccinia striiformis TaxID=27350 RepID=A0A2S4WMS7_9BASI|nr:hypothetical protein PSHT_00560 [Puccinia striiformis]
MWSTTLDNFLRSLHNNQNYSQITMCSPRVILAFALTLLSVSMVAAVDKCATEVINKVKYTRRACTFSDQQGNHYVPLYGANCGSNAQGACCLPTGPLNGNTCTIVGN